MRERNGNLLTLTHHSCTCYMLSSCFQGPMAVTFTWRRKKRLSWIAVEQRRTICTLLYTTSMWGWIFHSQTNNSHYPCFIAVQCGVNHLRIMHFKNIWLLTISSTHKRKALFFFFFLPGKALIAPPQLNPRLLERTSGSSSTWRPRRAWTWVRLRTNSPPVGRVFSVHALHGGCMASLPQNHNWKHGLLHSCNRCSSSFHGLALFSWSLRFKLQ